MGIQQSWRIVSPLGDVKDLFGRLSAIVRLLLKEQARINDRDHLDIQIRVRGERIIASFTEVYRIE